MSEKAKSQTIFSKLRRMEGLLSPAALAEILNFKTDTLQKRRSKKQPPAYITLSQNRVGYDPSEVADWLESLSSAPESQEATPPNTSPAKSPSSSGYDSRTGRMRVLRGDE